jgi:hypothetical protein
VPFIAKVKAIPDAESIVFKVGKLPTLNDGNYYIISS